MKSRRLIILIGLLCLGIFLSLAWYRNFEVSQIDASETLTIMKMFRDPHLYPDSFLLKQLYPIHFYSLYYWIAGFMAKLFDPYWAIYGYFIFTNCLCIGGLFYLAHAITKSLTASFFSVLALTLQFQWAHALGDAVPLGVGPMPDQVATGILLFSIAFFLQKRSPLAFAFAGFAFNFHASFSLFVLSMFIVALGVEHDWRKLSSGLCIYTLTALPMVLYMFLHPLPGFAGFPFDQWLQLVRIRSSGHTMPFLWGFGKYARFIPYIALFFYGWQRLKKSSDEADRGQLKKILSMSLGIALLCVLGTVFTEWIPVASVIKLTLFRSTRFFLIFAVLLYLAAIKDSLESKNKESAVHMVLLAALISASIPAIYISLVFLFLVSSGRWARYLVPLAVFASIAVFVWLLHRHGFHHFIGQSHAILLTGTFICLSPLYFLKQRLPLTYGVLAGVVILNALMPPDYGYRDSHYFQNAKRLQIWIRDNIPSHASLLLPPDTGIWSGLSMHANFLNYTEIAYSIYTPRLANEILEKTRAYVADPLGFSDGNQLLEAMIRSYKSWDEQKLLELSQQWGFDYLVSDSSTSYRLPMLYENDSFRVFRIRP